MRAFVALASTTLFAACATTTFAEPQLLVSPYLAIYQVRGDVSMQSQPTPGGPLQDNAPQSMDTFGQEHHREDVGVRADFGDGFAGVRLDYYKLDQNTGESGTLAADWGRLASGDVVSMSVDMQELRIGYLEPVLQTQTMWRERPIAMKFAAGGVLAYRDLALRAKTVDGARSQNAKIEGEVLYPALRFRATWRELGFDIDYAVSPHLSLGGDFEGVLQDLELRGSYTLAMRDVTFFAGYRYSTLPAEGTTDGFAYDADLQLDGFQLGVTVIF